MCMKPEGHVEDDELLDAGMHAGRRGNACATARVLGGARLVEDGNWDGQRGTGIGHVHDARQAALTGAARQQQVHLQPKGAALHKLLAWKHSKMRPACYTVALNSLR